MKFSHVGIPLLWKRIPTYHITLSNISFSMSALDFVCCSQLPSGVLLASPAAVAFGAGDMYRTSFPGRGKMMFVVMSLGKGRSFGKVWSGKQRQRCFECEVYGWNGVAVSLCVCVSQNACFAGFHTWLFRFLGTEASILLGSMMSLFIFFGSLYWGVSTFRRPHSFCWAFCWNFDDEGARRCQVDRYSRWWFQTVFVFIPIWGNDPIWLIFFRWVGSTTN